MISDSSKIENTAEVLEQLIKDNDIDNPDGRLNSFDSKINAFPYAEVLLSHEVRITRMENFLKERGLDL